MLDRIWEHLPVYIRGQYRISTIHYLTRYFLASVFKQTFVLTRHHDTILSRNGHLFEKDVNLLNDSNFGMDVDCSFELKPQKSSPFFMMRVSSPTPSYGSPSRRSRNHASPSPTSLSSMGLPQVPRFD